MSVDQSVARPIETAKFLLIMIQRLVS